MRFPQFSHVPRNNFNFYAAPKSHFPRHTMENFIGRVLSRPFLFVHGRSSGLFNATPRQLPFFFVPFGYSYGIMIMTISAIVESSVNGKSSGSYKLDETRPGMHHTAYRPCERHWSTLILDAAFLFPKIKPEKTNLSLFPINLLFLMILINMFNCLEAK